MTDAEVARAYPCDALVSAPALQAWRGVSVTAPAQVVWAWLCQVRLAPYSYDWIDNLGRRSPRDLRELPEPVPGDPFSATAGRPLGRILAVEPGAALTARIIGAVMSYVVVPDGDGARLLLKIVMAGPRWAAPLVSAGDLLMARRQLLNLKGLAEQTAAAR